MTRKYFKMFADALRDSRPTLRQAAHVHMQWLDDCGAVADVCARVNPNFDRDKFLEACGVNS